MNEKPIFDQSPVDEHPLFETLRAYHIGELKSEEDEAVREHLVGCGDCAAIILEMAGLAPEDSAADVELSEMDVDRAWRKARVRLREDGVVERPQPRRPRLDRRPAYRVLALAAVVLISVAAVFMLRQTAGVGVALEARVTLEPMSPSRGTEGAGPCISLPAARAWTLRLPVNDGTSFPSYRLELHTEDQRRVATRDPEPVDGGFVALFSSTELPPGRYRLSLAGLGEGEPILVEQYCFEVSGTD